MTCGPGRRLNMRKSWFAKPRKTHFGWTLELVVVPVADVDRAKGFYLEQVGFDLLVERGAVPSELFHFRAGAQMPRPDPERRSCNSVVSFSDPDCNRWLVQEVRRTDCPTARV